MEDVNLANDLARMLERFKEAGKRIAEGADFRLVLDAFGDFEADKLLLRERRAGSVHPHSASVESIFLVVDTAADTVSLLHMHFKEGITLGALQAQLGAWYRDPPEPVEAACTSAYFNPRQIDPRAPFLLSAFIEEWCDRFTPYTVVNSLNIDFRDERRVTDRPW